MAKIAHYYTRFEEGEFYHVYNRSVDKQPMFKTEGNHLFFLERLHHFLAEIGSIYAHCLLDNHFHLLLKVNDDLTAYRLTYQIPDSIPTHLIVSKQFRIFFQCYAQKFNYENNRCGTLFQTPFKRSWVKDHQYLIYLIYYIHTNAQKHSLTDDFKNWYWSSYARIMSEGNSEFQQKILNWFGGITGYINFHSLRMEDFESLTQIEDNSKKKV